MQPKVLVSHASEDKERFVRGFAQRLRSNHIDAWVDPWEMHSNDSLLEKVFGEDINGTSAVIVVLSQNSVTKPWIAEEIDDRFVRIINRSSRILPVVIDDCRIPDVLKPSNAIHIQNLTQYDAELARITGEIPGLVVPEQPLQSATLKEHVFHASCLNYINNRGQAVSSSEIFQALEMLAPSRRQFDRVLLGLKQQFLIESMSIGSSTPRAFTITHVGLEQYLTRNLPTYHTITDSVVSTIVYQEALYNFQITSLINQPLQIVNHILEKLHGQGRIQLRKSGDGTVEIKSISPLLREHS